MLGTNFLIMNKKLIYLLMIMLGICIISCKKNTPFVKDNKIVPENVSIILESIKKSSVKYQNESKDKPNWKKILKIAGKDITGALSGAGTGAAVGGLIGAGIVGVGAGAGVITCAAYGALAGGIGSSLYEGGTKSAPPSSTNYSFNINIGNAYENLAIEHIYILNLGLSNKDLFFIFDSINNVYVLQNGTFINYLIDREVTLGLITEDYTECFNSSALESLNSSLDNFFPFDSDFFVKFPIYSNYLQSSGVISENVKLVLNSYFANMEVLSSLESVISYSESVEIASNLSDIDKCLLLTTMALTRHDITYWFI